MNITQKNKRVAIVTGAARGIGAAIAQRLAHDGHALALLDVDEAACSDVAQGLREAGYCTMPLAADVTDRDAILAAVNRVCTELGPPDILVNNAGFARDKTLEAMTAEDWDSVQAVHLRGAFMLAQAVHGHMAAGGWGRIVNIASTSALGHPDRANYCAAKAGLIGLTRALAVELGPQGITVNAVAPGLIVTRMTEATAARHGRRLDEHLAVAAAQLPVRRAGQPGDVATAVSFFAGEDAGFITGQTLYVSGGPAA